MKRVAAVLAAFALWGMGGVSFADHPRQTGINCEDLPFQEDAQAYFDAHPGDPEGLDGPIGPTSAGVPGVACEHLPSRGTDTTVETIPTIEGAEQTRIISVTPAPVSPAPSTPGQGLLSRTG